MRNRRFAAIVLAVAMAAMTIAATTASARPQQAGATQAKKAAAGGVFRTEWESSFDFTDSFDPTGEYLGEAFGIYSQPARAHARRLQPRRRARPATCSSPTSRRTSARSRTAASTYTFHLKHGIKFGPPLNREITSKDIAVRIPAHRHESAGRAVRLLLRRDQGHGGVRGRQGQGHLGHRDARSKTIIFNLTAPTGDFRYRLGMPAAGPMPQEVAGCFTKAGRLRPLRHLLGPVHDRRARTSSTPRAAHTIKAAGRISGFDGETIARPRPQPGLRPAQRQHQGARELPGRVHVHRQLEHRRHLRQASRAGRHRGRGRQRDADGPAPSTRTRRSCTRTTSDRTWLPHDEPDAAAVRRRPRAPRGQLRRRPRRAAQGARRRLGRRDRDAHRSQRDPASTSSRATRPTAHGRGDLAKAKAEMKLSRYDSNHDGICDAKACKSIFTDHGRPPVEMGFIPSLTQNLASIGIKHPGPRAQGRLHPDPDAAPEHPVLDAARLGQGLRRRADVLRPALRRPQHHPAGQHELLPARHHAGDRQEGRRQAATSRASRASTATSTSCGVLVGNAARHLLRGARQEAHLEDRSVGSVPVGLDAQSVSSKNVTKFEFDQFGGTIAYAHVAVK